MLVNRCLLILVLTGSICCCALDQCLAELPDEQFERDVSEYLRRLEKLGFAGTVTVKLDGRTIINQGYGLADRERTVKWSPETVSSIGSITKQFTGAAILALADKGVLDTRDTITKYFRDVPEDKRSITLHQLLTHTSGIIDLDSAGDYDPIGREEFVRRILAQPLSLAPGEGYEYTNAGYSLLGAIIETVTGDTYEQFLRETFFVPNGMLKTGYVLPDWDTTQFAQGYTPEGLWGTALRKPMAADGPYWVLRANGGIHSTANDMLRWAEALLAGKALSPYSLERYWMPHADEGEGISYGYGWSIAMSPVGDKIVTHNGGNGVFFADMMMIPNRSLIVFVQTNVPAEMLVAEDVLQAIGRRLLEGTPFPELPDMVDVPVSELSAVIGTYKIDDSNHFDIEVHGRRLLLTPSGWDAFALLHSTDSVDLRLCHLLSSRMDTIVSAFVVGNFGPMFEALNHKASLEQLETKWKDRLSTWQTEHGQLKGVRILGTALQDTRDLTLVRFLFDNGSADRAYVWEKGAERHLLGYSLRGLNAVLSCVAVNGGGYASWNPTTGKSRPFRIDTAGARSIFRLAHDGTESVAVRLSRQ